MSEDPDRHGVWLVIALLFQALVGLCFELWLLVSWVWSWFS